MLSSPGGGSREPQDQSAALAQLKSTITRLDRRVHALDTRLQDVQQMVQQIAALVTPAAAPTNLEPTPIGTQPAPPTRPSGGSPGRGVQPAANGTFEDLFLRDVGLSHPELRERTRRLLQAKPVLVSGSEHQQLLAVLEPYLQTGNSSAPAARWVRTKLEVWIEAARQTSAATAR